MNKIKIKTTEAELRALAWEEDSNPEAYHVERDEDIDGKLRVVSDGNGDAYYGATACLPDGRELIVIEDWSGEREISVDGEDAALTVVDADGREIIPDWGEITGYTCHAPTTEDDAWAARADAVCRFVGDFCAAGGKAYRQDGGYDNVYTVWLCAGKTVCGDGIVRLPSGVDVGKLRELDADEAVRAVRFALIGNRCHDYNGATAYLVDGRSYGCEIDTATGETDATDIDMSHNEAVEMAKREIDDGALRVRVVEVRCDYIIERSCWHKSGPEIAALINNPRAVAEAANHG